MKKILKIERIRTSWLKWLLSGLLLSLLAYLSFRVFRNCNYCWVIILLTVFTYFLLLGLKSQIATLKILFFNISAVFLALFFYECFLWLSDISQENSKHVLLGNFEWTKHPYLGYGPKNNGIFTSKKTVDKEKIYDVSYTIKDGLRYTPNSNEKSQKCVLFFGCSITFGSGLADTSTLPFFFNQYAKHRFKIFNYGFGGYGPHQMLANIESRVAGDIQSYNNEKIAIYSFIPFHIGRAAGFSTWDQHGPRYEIIEGRLRKVGSFTNLPRRITGRLSRSYIYRRLFFERKPRHYDVMRTIEIIKKSNVLLLKQHVILYVFVWDNPRAIENAFQNQNDYYFFLDKMKKNNIKTFFLHDLITNYNEKDNTYSLPHDGHPNALANKKIANYIYLQLNDIKTKVKEKQQWNF